VSSIILGFFLPDLSEIHHEFGSSLLLNFHLFLLVGVFPWSYGPVLYACASHSAGISSVKRSLFLSLTAAFLSFFLVAGFQLADSAPTPTLTPTLILILSLILTGQCSSYSGWGWGDPKKSRFCVFEPVTPTSVLNGTLDPFANSELSGYYKQGQIQLSAALSIFSSLGIGAYLLWREKWEDSSFTVRNKVGVVVLLCCWFFSSVWSILVTEMYTCDDGGHHDELVPEWQWMLALIVEMPLKYYIFLYESRYWTTMNFGDDGSHHDLTLFDTPLAKTVSKGLQQVHNRELYAPLRGSTGLQARCFIPCPCSQL